MSTTPRPYERTRQIMRVVAESMAEGGSERGFALQDAARAAIETLEDELAAALGSISDSPKREEWVCLDCGAVNQCHSAPTGGGDADVVCDRCGSKDVEEGFANAIRQIIEREDTRVARLDSYAEAASEVLRDASVALNDWTLTYARELCNAEAVDDAWKRIVEGGGTLAYIADLRARIDTTLRSIEKAGSLDTSKPTSKEIGLEIRQDGWKCCGQKGADGECCNCPEIVPAIGTLDTALLDDIERKARAALASTVPMQMMKADHLLALVLAARACPSQGQVDMTAEEWRQAAEGLNADVTRFGEAISDTIDALEDLRDGEGPISREWLAGFLQQRIQALRATLSSSPSVVTSQFRAPEGFVLVPKAALDWLYGEHPDDPFGPPDDEPRRPDGTPMARYWWRSQFRRRCAIGNAQGFQGETK